MTFEKWFSESVFADKGAAMKEALRDSWEASKRQAARSQGGEAVVWLGNGDKLVADIHAEDGSWAGVGVFNPPNGKTGGIGEPDGQIDGAPLDDNPPILSIRSHKPESLQVVVDELKESIARMGCTQPQSALVAPIPEISCHETVHGPGEVKRLDDWLEYFDKYSDYHESLALQATIKYLRSLNSTPKPQSAVPEGWIKCSDRLPTEDDADIDGNVWYSSTVGGHRESYTRAQLLSKKRRESVLWHPTGLKRPQPPQEQSDE